tara:strand:+ start:2479 stop:3243 length:765 start_codon:yes stop_codon:yes gene_type:complete
VILPRSDAEIAGIACAGEIVAAALQAAVGLVEPGVTTGTLDKAVADVISASEAEAIFLAEGGRTPFPAASCVSVNHQALHGIPGDLALASGDLVTIDTGCRLNGWCADAAISTGVGELSSENQRLLAGGRRVLEGVLEAMEGLAERIHWSEVVDRAHAEASHMGVRLIEGPAGHGIGRVLHEDPVAGWSRPVTADFEVVPGLVLAVEPVVTSGDGRLSLSKDGWTLSTVDGHPTVHFERTVAVTEAGVTVLTRW